MHDVFIDVNQAINCSLPKQKPQSETPGSEKQELFLQEKQTDSLLPDLQRWQMREKVIPHKEAHEDPVINTPFKIKSERQAGHGEFSLQVLQYTHKRRSSENTAWGLNGINSQQLQQPLRLTSRRTHRRMKMNSCSETGRVSAN